MKIIVSTLCIALLFLSFSVSAQLKGDGFDWYSQGKTVHFFPQDSTGDKYKWDFGDVLGGTSEEMTPTYNYLAANGKYQVTLIVTDSQGNDTTYIDNVGTGTEDNSTIKVVTSVTGQLQSQSSLHLYPNPASASVHVLLPITYTNSTIRLFDISGRKLMEQFTKPVQNIEINIAHFPEGMYFLEIHNAEKIEVRKLQI